MYDTREIQTLLKARGYDVGGVDGLWGPLTMNAVAAFQRSIGLTGVGANGMIGEYTMGKLRGTTLAAPSELASSNFLVCASQYLYRNRVQVPYRATPNKGGHLEPRILILHDTAGRLDGKSSVDWMCNPKARASAHLFIDRKGKVTQLAPFNVQTWHAGKSAYRGKSGVNALGIGIEIENPGAMTAGPPGYAKAWWGDNFRIDSYGIVRMGDTDHPTAHWMPYTPEQIRTVTEITKALVKAYRLVDVSTHYAISPKRKVDVNPLFPLEQLRREIYGPYASAMGRA